MTSSSDHQRWVDHVEQRGAHYYRSRLPIETAPYMAPCIDSQSQLRAAFLRGYEQAQREETQQA